MTISSGILRVPDQSGPTWHSSPVGELLIKDLGRAGSEALLISPFVSLNPVQQICDQLPGSCGLTLVTGWDIGSFASGASDFDALLHVANHIGGSVRIVHRLHAKVFSRDWTTWWVGSANLTNSGLGFTERPNLEMVAEVTVPTVSLLEAVRAILYGSIEVSAEYLESVRMIVEEGKKRIGEPLGYLEAMTADTWRHLRALPNADVFMVQELPLCASPAVFLNALADGPPFGADVNHDCALFALVPNDPVDVQRAKIRVGLLRIPLVRSLDAFLAEPRTFGAVTAWIHDRCEDRPLPYRSEIKELTARTMDWLLGTYPSRYQRSRPGYSEVFVRITGRG
jgi:hypothetical protein